MSNAALEISFSDGVRPFWPYGLQNIKKPEFSSVEDWLIKGTYTWTSSVSDEIRLSHPQLQSGLTEALAGEISRFSTASYESLLDAEPSGLSKKALGWQIVRHYYAAFYSAHALLRIAGISLFFLSPESANTLNRLGGQYLGFSPQITKGLYSVRRDSAAPDTVILKKLSAGGGSHEDMWKEFLSFLIKLEESIVLTQGPIPSALVALEISTTLRANLCKKGKANGAWPSSIRNAVNYRHDLSVWYPYGQRQPFYDSVASKMCMWKPSNLGGFSFSKTNNDLISFAEICNVLSHVLTATLKDISMRSPSSNKCFVDRVSFKLLRERGVVV